MALPIESTGFSDALVILGAAGIVIPAFSRLRISPVIGFILVGAAVGPAGLGRLVAHAPWLYFVTISDPHAMEPFAELGIVLLLFSIGLELSFGRLWSMRRRVFGLGAAELIGGGLLLGAGFLPFGYSTAAAFGLGFALALSSTALVLPIAGTRGPVGERAFAMLLFEDLALVPIIFALGAIGGSGGIATIARTLLLGGLTVAGLLLFGRLLLPRLFAQAARTKSPELFLAVSLLVVILASLATTAAGLSPIVGALVAGILIAETDYHDEVEAITAPFKGLALGVFLITVGMSLDPQTIAASWLALVAATLSVVAIKALLTMLLLRFGGTRAGIAFEVGLMMAAPSETTLIVLSAAASAGIVGRETVAFWQIVTAIGLTITPLLALAGGGIRKRLERQAATTPAATAEEDGEEMRTVIVGLGRVGRLVAQMFQEHGLPYLAVDADPDVVASARARGYAAQFGDVARGGIIERLDIGRATAVVLTMDDRVQAVRLTRQLRAAYADLTIVVRARDPNHAAQLYRAGATDAVPETVEASLQLSEAALVDLGVAMGPVIASIHEKRASLRAKIMEMAELDRAPRPRTTLAAHEPS